MDSYQVEHWDENEPDTVIADCERCGEQRPCQSVIDPFTVEGINERPRVKQWCCKPCFEERAGDV